MVQLCFFFSLLLRTNERGGDCSEITMSCVCICVVVVVFSGASALNQPIGQLMKRGPATCLSGEMAYNAMLEMERSDASSFVSIIIIIPFFLVI